MKSTPHTRIQHPLLALLIHGETVRKAELRQPLLHLPRNVRRVVRSVHTGAVLHDRRVEDLGRGAQRGNGLAPPVRVLKRLRGAAGRVQRRPVLRVKELLGALGNNDAVKGVRAGRAVRSVDALGHSLANDDDGDLVLGELLLQLRRLLERALIVNRREHADLEPDDRLELLAHDGVALRRVVVVVLGVRLGHLDADDGRDTLGELVADPVQLRDDVLPDRLGLDVARLEADGVDEELLLLGGERVVEEARLRPVVEEGVGVLADEGTRDAAAGSGEETAALVLVRLEGRVVADGVGLICSEC